MSNAISAQGTIVKRNGTPIAELRDITPPALTRNPIERTNHNDLDDSWIVGIRRKGELQFTLGFLPSGDASHNHSEGLVKAWVDGSNDLYEVEFPDNVEWVFSGYVTNISPTAPVDGLLEAQVSVRPSGAHIFRAPA